MTTTIQRAGQPAVHAARRERERERDTGARVYSVTLVKVARARWVLYRGAPSRGSLERRAREISYKVSAALLCCAMRACSGGM